MRVPLRRIVLVVLVVLAAAWAYWSQRSTPKVTATSPAKIILADPAPEVSPAPLESEPVRLQKPKQPPCDANDPMCGDP